ncbi:MAG: hypothetical protein ACRD1F_11870 [Terriglobales bacterium]
MKTGLRLTLAVIVLLVLNQEAPDIAVQLAAGHASPYAMIGVRAGILLIGLLLNWLDPLGALRARVESVASVAAAVVAAPAQPAPAQEVQSAG